MISKEEEEAERRELSKATEKVVHPDHYGGDRPYEPIKVILAWHLNFPLGSVLKYVYRAGKKDGELDVTDLKKARQYLDFEIADREKKQEQDREDAKNVFAVAAKMETNI